MRSPKLRKAYDVCFFNDGQAFVSTTGSSLECWTDEGCTRTASAKFPYPSGLDLAPDGRRVLAKSTTGHLAVFSLPDLSLLASPTHRQRVREGPAALFSPCGEFVVDGCWDGSLTCREIATGTIRLREEHAGHTVQHVSCSADRRTFAYSRKRKGSEERSPGRSRVWLRQWPLETSAEVSVRGLWHWIGAIALSPDARRIAIMHTRTGVKWFLDVVDTASGARWARLEMELGARACVAWSPNGERLGVVQSERIAIARAEDLGLIAVHENPYPSAISFSPDGTSVAIGSWERGEVLKVRAPAPESGRPRRVEA